MRFTFRQNILKALCYPELYCVQIPVSVLMSQNNTTKNICNIKSYTRRFVDNQRKGYAYLYL